MSEPIGDTSFPRVVAVEDNPADVRLVEEGVDASEVELDLRVINSGRQAIERLTAIDAETPRHHPNLLLLDLNIPGRSGFDVLAAIRNETVFPDVPVVVVSSSESRDDVNRAYDLSANAYVTKPADPDDYIEMITATVELWVASTDRSAIHD